MNLLITLSFILAIAIGLLVINRCLEWWERKAFEKGIAEANSKASPFLVDAKPYRDRRKRAT